MEKVTEIVLAVGRNSARFCDFNSCLPTLFTNRYVRINTAIGCAFLYLKLQNLWMEHFACKLEIHRNKRIKNLFTAFRLIYFTINRIAR